MSEVSCAATLCKVVLQNLSGLELNPSLHHFHAWLQPLWTDFVVGWGLPWSKPWQWHLGAKASRIPCHVSVLSVLSVVSVGSWHKDSNQALWLGRSFRFPGKSPSFEQSLAQRRLNQTWIKRTTTESCKKSYQQCCNMPFFDSAPAPHMPVQATSLVANENCMGE